MKSAPMLKPVLLTQAYRLLNHGPTVLVSTAYGNQKNVMAAAWNMPLDFNPPKIAIVIDKNTYTFRNQRPLQGASRDGGASGLQLWARADREGCKR